MKSSRLNTVLRSATALFVVVLIGFVLCMMPLMREIEGNARVVNYAGIVRGGTQLLVKEELMNHPNDAQIERLDNIMQGLRTGESQFDIARLNDEAYLAKLESLNNQWAELKSTVYAARADDSYDALLYDQSEAYFKAADETVFAAEDASNTQMSTLETLQLFTIGIIVVLAALLIAQGIQTFKIMKNNKRLNSMAFIDEDTQLPNKRRCDDFLHDTTPIQPSDEVWFAMFDLNNLKYVNDRYGHNRGDAFITGFANILKNEAHKESFVGRFGGDEFIVIAKPSSKSITDDYIQRVRDVVRKANETEPDKMAQLSFAYGVAGSSEMDKACTMQDLMDVADKRMYACKSAIKQTWGRRATDRS